MQYSCHSRRKHGASTWIFGAFQPKSTRALVRCGTNGRNTPFTENVFGFSWSCFSDGLSRFLQSSFWVGSLRQHHWSQVAPPMTLEDLQAQVPGLQACQLSLGAGLKLDILISSYIAITENGEKNTCRSTKQIMRNQEVIQNAEICLG